MSTADPPAASRRASTPAGAGAGGPLSHPAFRAYLIGAFSGLMGMWMMRVALGWLTWQATGSAGWVGAVAFLNFAPTIFAGPVFGVVADRLDPRRAMAGTQSVQMVCAALLAVAASAGPPGVGTLSALALASGLAASFYHPLRLTLAPRLVPPAALPQAVAMTALNFNLTRTMGPALGGWLIAGPGPGPALALAALLFLPQIGALATLPPQPPAPRDPDSAPGLLAALAEGARHARDHPRILEAMWVTGLSAVAARGILELLPVAADGVFEAGAAGLGALTAAAGAGAILASLWMARRGAGPRTLRRRARGAGVLGAALTAALGWAPGIEAALILVAGLGFAGTVVGVACQSIAQAETPDGRRGRVMSLWIVVGIGGSALGAVALGLLADAVGLPAALTGAGLAAGAALALAPAPGGRPAAE